MEKSRKQLQRRNTVNLMFWTVGWTLTVALVTFGSKYLWNFNSGYSMLFILLNVLVGAGMILANIRFINDLDEMIKKIYLDAMGIALGVTLVGGIAYSMLDTTNVISSDAEIAFVVVLMAVAYMSAIIIGYLRYK